MEEEERESRRDDGANETLTAVSLVFARRGRVCRRARTPLPPSSKTAGETSFRRRLAIVNRVAESDSPHSLGSGDERVLPVEAETDREVAERGATNESRLSKEESAS